MNTYVYGDGFNLYVSKDHSEIAAPHLGSPIGLPK